MSEADRDLLARFVSFTERAVPHLETLESVQLDGQRPAILALIAEARALLALARSR